MSPEESPPSLAAEWAETVEQESTRDRVYAVALELHEPTRVSEVATAADVSTETAREYLRWFAELGVLDRVSEAPATFRRNGDYFAWRRVQELRRESPEELRDRLDRLTAREREFAERFDADTPDAVDALEHGGYAELDETWTTLERWRTVRRRIRELERARQRDDDRRTPA